MDDNEDFSVGEDRLQIVGIVVLHRLTLNLFFHVCYVSNQHIK